MSAVRIQTVAKFCVGHTFTDSYWKDENKDAWNGSFNKIADFLFIVKMIKIQKIKDIRKIKTMKKNNKMKKKKEN